MIDGKQADGARDGLMNDIHCPLCGRPLLANQRKVFVDTRSLPFPKPTCTGMHHAECIESLAPQYQQRELLR